MTYEARRLLDLVALEGLGRRLGVGRRSALPLTLALGLALALALLLGLALYIFRRVQGLLDSALVVDTASLAR